MDSIFQNPAFSQLNKGMLHQVSLSPSQREDFYTWLISDSSEAKQPPKPSLVSLDEISMREHTLLALKQQPVSDNTFQKWLKYKVQETAVLRAVYELQHGGKSAAFQTANQALYGELDNDLFFGYIKLLFTKSKSIAGKEITRAEAKELIGGIPADTPPLVVPTRAQFKYYKGLLLQYYRPLIQILNDLPQPGADNITPGIEVARFVHELLGATGLLEEGWQVATSHNVDKVSVNAMSKRVHVAERDFHLSRARLQGLLLHEIGVHVMRRHAQTGLQAQFMNTSVSSMAVEEGLGVLVEQLCLSQFISLRIFRYLALGLAIGINAKPRDARQVYEILWRLRYISQPGMDLQKAKHFAALETMRIFRGIMPNMPGAVLLRDKVYVEGNHLWWQHLLAHKLDYETFAGLLARKAS
jgi:hypothetical protein